MVANEVDAEDSKEGSKVKTLVLVINVLVVDKLTIRKSMKRMLGMLLLKRQEKRTRKEKCF